MAELFQRIRTQLTNLYQSLDRRMKIWLAAGGLFVVLLVVVILFLTRPEYVSLQSNLEWDEMGRIVAKLDEEGISHKDEENAVLVDISDLTKAKMLLATEPGISTPDYGWTDVFADTSFTMTSQIREHQIMQAKASSIKQGIETIQGVSDAVVELYIAPEASYVLENKLESSISVILIMESGASLSQNEVEGIVNYILNTVQNLPKENITIIDQTGQTLNRLSENTDAFIASSMNEQTQIVQNQINDKLTNFLGAVYGRTNVRVSSAVKLDFDSKTTTSKIFAPPVEGATEGLIRSLTELSESVSDSDTAEGVPGTDSNVDVTDYPSTTGTGNRIESASRTVNYEMNEIVEVLEKARGTISDITISVLINSKVMDDNTLTDEHKQDLIALVTSAAGLETRNVTVVAREFAEDEFGLQAYNGDNELITPGIPLWLVGIIIGTLAIVVIIIVVVMRVKANKEKAQEIAAIQAAEEEKRQSELEEIRTDVEDKSSPKYQIEKFIEAKPEAVAMLLRSWMSEM